MVDAKLSAKLLTKHIFKYDKKEDMLHSSGYAQVQNGANVGAASAESFAARQAINENRRYVQGYKNSRIMNEFYGVQRARERAGYGRYGGRNQGEQEKAVEAREAEHPIDSAMRRAEFSSKNRIGSVKTQVGSMTGGTQAVSGARAKGPVLGNARAPQVPMRRGGI